MNLCISFLNLISDFKDLPFGQYVIQITYNAKDTRFWFASYTDYDGLVINGDEIISSEDEFEYEIYSQTFMEEAFRFYNHELEKNL